jgi:CubicO group peptidase (beta-lactamase class C family)
LGCNNNGKEIAPALGDCESGIGVACNSDIYPDAEWELGDPVEHGLSPEGLKAMAAVAEQYDTSCMMVIHNGVLVGEWYWNGFQRDTPVANVFSTTKSITSTLLGIAQAEGKLYIDDSAADYIPEWQYTDSKAVTIRDLISNDSGRFWSFDSDYGTGLIMSADQTAYAVGLSQQFEPGTVWEYNNSAIQTLDAVLSYALDGQQSIADYAQEKLFKPIGASASMGVDPSGNVLTYVGVTASCDDMARFGYLALRKGRWKEQQIVPKSWIEEATKPSTALNDAYGYMWWLNREGHVVEPSFPTRSEYDGQLVPAASENLYSAIGAFGQFVSVQPDDGFVIVRLQNVEDINAAFQTSPDPIGLTQLEEILTAFEAAKL